eukprot:5780828-Pyramimonas_sp.AAC.1
MTFGVPTAAVTHVHQLITTSVTHRAQGSRYGRKLAVSDSMISRVLLALATCLQSATPDALCEDGPRTRGSARPPRRAL